MSLLLGLLNKLEEAIQDYSQAIKLNPDVASAYHHRGIAYGRIGQQEKAELDFSKSSELDPNKYPSA